LCIHNETLRDISLLIVSGILMLLSMSLLAQPANDDCQAAIPIACGETISGTTIDAQADAVDVCNVSATAPGVFYSFTGTGEETTVSLCSANTDYDTKLSIFQGDCNSLICLDGNDDACGLVSEVTFNSVAGTLYLIYVHGFSSSTGNFDLTVTCGGVVSDDSCSAPGAGISDTIASTTDQITMATGSADVITDLNVSIDITHTYISDLTITLQSPSGTTIVLFDGSCGSADDMDALFDDSGASLACPPVGGTFLPLQPLSAFIGESVDGNWTLSIVDNFSGDDGILNEWCLFPTLGPPIIIPNDHCGDAIPIACGETLQGSTLGADIDTGAGTCGTASVTSPGVWYKFTGDGSIVTASLCNAATYDTKIGVYTDGCGTLTCVAGNDDGAACAGFTSEVSFSSTAGVEYLILVHGFGGAGGDFALTITCETAPTNDNCDNATPIGCNQFVSGSTIGTTVDSTGDCGTANTAPGVWYSFTGTGEYVTISTCDAATYDTKISVFTGTCGNLTCVGGNDDFPGCAGFTSQFGFLSETGTEYLILIHGFQSETGTFDLFVSCQPITVPNDFCSGALPIACGDVVTGSTTAATPDSEAPCVVSNTSNGVWYTFTGDGSLVTATTCNAGNLYDTKISVYAGSCDSLSCIAGNDDDNGCVYDPFYSTVTWIADAGTDYFILVHGFGSETGTFELSLTCSAPLENDDCSGATPVTLVNGTPVTITGSTMGGTASADETAVLGAAAVWQAVTLTGECNNLTVDYCGTAPDVMSVFFVVYTDCPLTEYTLGASDLTRCADVNGAVVFYNLPAGTYYLPVLADPFYIVPGDYTMNILSEDCPPPPANDNVCNAKPLLLGTPVPFSNFSATAEEAEVSPGAGSAPGATCLSQDGWCALDSMVQNSIWYSFTAPPSGHVIITSDSIDTQIAVYSVGKCDDFSSFTEMGANDDSNPACVFCPMVELTCLIPGQTYYVQLDGFASAFGTGTITAVDAGLTSIVSGYTLVNSTTDADVSPLLDGDIINKRALPGFNIRADFCRPIGSAKFDLNGIPFRTENFIPYAVGGDNPIGNYKKLNLPVGTYQLVTFPYTGANAGGTPTGAPDTLNFSVIDEDCVPLIIVINTDAFGEETSFELEDLTDNTIISSAAPGTLAGLATFRQPLCVNSTHCYEFRIFDAFGDGICCAYGNGSYLVTFNGQVVASGGTFADSEITPFGDDCSLDCAGVPGGSSVTDINGNCCLPSELDCDGICFGGNTTGIAVTSFTLIDAQNDVEIGPLSDGDTIDLELTGPISIRANVCNDSNVESVKFFVNGSLFKIENIIFYSIAGDNNGNYAAWNVQPGVYTITANPFSGDNGSGTAGTGLTITITIISGSQKTGESIYSGTEDVSMKAYPNPFNDILIFEFMIADDSPLTIELFSISGAKIATVFEGRVTGGLINQQVFYPKDLASGLYVFKMKSNTTVITGRVTLSR